MTSLDHVKEWNNYQNSELIDHIYQNHKIKQTETENKIFWCPKCDNLQDDTYVSVEYDRGKRFISIFKCKRCQTELKPLQKVYLINKKRCPDCGKKSLSLEETGIWD